MIDEIPPEESATPIPPGTHQAATARSRFARGDALGRQVLCDGRSYRPLVSTGHLGLGPLDTLGNQRPVLLR